MDETRRTKWCTHCGHEKPVSEFWDNGLGVPCSRCKDCHRYFQRERMRRLSKNPRWVRRRNARRRARGRHILARRRSHRLQMLALPTRARAAAKAWGIRVDCAAWYLRRLERLGLVRRIEINPRRVLWQAKGRSRARAIERALEV